MVTIAIIGNGPSELLPELSKYKKEVDIWIGADRGALTLINQEIEVAYAVGDFDSISELENERIKNTAKTYLRYPAEKDYTDIEIALLKAYELNPTKIYLFGVTGGRLDHGLVNIQLLYSIVKKSIQGIIVDKYNQVELTTPNHYEVEHHEDYPYVSFIPFSEHVKKLTLTGFYYALDQENISWGSTLCISNKLLSNKGTFYYEEGILLLIKSRDKGSTTLDRKSTRLNSSHVAISYAVFCLKKKNRSMKMGRGNGCNVVMC